MTLDAQYDLTVSQFASVSDQNHSPSPDQAPAHQSDLDIPSAEDDVAASPTPTNEFEGFGSFSG